MQTQRLFEIVYLLLDKKQMTAQALAEHFEVSVRTIYRDIDRLSQAGVPLYTKQGQNGGITILEGFKLNKSLLDREEQQRILTALESLAATGLNEQALLERLSRFFACSADWIKVDYIAWGEENKGLFEQLKEAAMKQQTLTFDYYNSNGEYSHRKAAALRLIFKSRSWYLQGYCYERNDYRLFKLKRMQKVVLLAEYGEFDVPDIDFERPSFAQTEIVLKIKSTAAWRIYDEFTPAEITVLDDGDFLIHSKRPIDRWLLGYILSFGELAEILAPKTLRQNLVAELEKMQRIYKE